MQTGERGGLLTHSAHILVVDDEPGSRILLETLLRSQGYRVSGATDGSEAIAQIESGDVDLVVLDLMMPRVDGIEVCEVVRKRLALLNLPLLLTSALSNRESRVRAKEAGADDFLSKPVDGLELLVRARNLLKLRAYQLEIERRSRDLTLEMSHISERLAAMSTAGTMADLLRARLEDLSGSLAAATGRLGIALERDEPPRHEDLLCIGRVRRQLEHCARGVGELFKAFERRDEGPSDVCCLLQSAVEALREGGGLEKLQIILELPARRPLVTMPGGHLEQIVLSMLRSSARAFRASFASGAISVRVTWLEEGSRVRLFVADNRYASPSAALQQGLLDETDLDLKFVRQASEAVGGRMIITHAAHAGRTVGVDLPAVVESSLSTCERNLP